MENKSLSLNNKNVNFPPQFCQQSMSNGFGAAEVLWFFS